MTSKLVPARIRQALSLESGLNDGLSIPLLMLFIALARVDSPATDSSWILYTAQQIGFGVLVGLVFGWLGGWLTANASKRGWMTATGQQLAMLALAIAAWWLAEKGINGNGFIAAFVAGTMVRRGFEVAGEQMAELGCTDLQCSLWVGLAHAVWLLSSWVSSFSNRRLSYPGNLSSSWP
jgi:NhaP-type Na+/H+ or K+/H+ antiporter